LPHDKDLATDRDFYDVDFTWDRNSNVTARDNQVYSAANLSRNYTMDDLDRLLEEEFVDISSVYLGESVTQMSIAGPIDRMKLDLNGDTDYIDSNEMDDSRDFNKANELLTRDVDSDAAVDYTLSHDAVGSLTDDDQYHEYVYDVWGRLRKVNNQTPNPVSEYRYNGLNRRISMQHDDDADGDLDSADKTY